MYYAIAKGRRTGIIKCHPNQYRIKLAQLTDCYAGNCFKKFDKLSDAEEFMRRNGKRRCTVIDITKSGSEEEQNLQIEICNVCEETVGSEARHPLCDGCQVWHHLACVKMKEEDIPEEGVEWFCDKCRIIKLTEENEVLRREIERLKKAENRAEEEDDGAHMGKNAVQQDGDAPVELRREENEGDTQRTDEPNDVHEYNETPIVERVTEIEDTSSGNLDGRESNGNDVEQKQVILIGSSNVRRFDRYIFKNQSSIKKKDVLIGCYPGARLEDVEAVIPEMATTEKKVKVYIHAGTNNLTVEGNRETLRKMKKLVNTCKRKWSGAEVAVCSLPPRMDKGDYIWNRGQSLNAMIEETARKEDFEFIDLTIKDKYDSYGSVVGRDGVHYSQRGSLVVGQLIGQNMSSFLA